MSFGGKIAEYTGFIVMCIIFTVLFWLFKYDLDKLKLLALAGALFYIFWGIIHQALSHRLSILTAAEYVFIGFFAYLILLIALTF